MNSPLTETLSIKEDLLCNVMSSFGDRVNRVINVMDTLPEDNMMHLANITSTTFINDISQSSTEKVSHLRGHPRSMRMSTLRSLLVL